MLILCSRPLVVNACRKDHGGEEQIVQPGAKETRPDGKDYFVRSGFVTDEADNPVPFVIVIAGDKQVKTDEFDILKQRVLHSNQPAVKAETFWSL